MYDAFADVYDTFNDAADYDALFSAVRERLQKNGIEKGIVADLGCGTGELTLRLAAAGYDMIGVDLSSEMLCQVRSKMEQSGLNGLLLLQQDLCELDLYGTVRAAVSTFDTLNHIGPLPRLERAIARAAFFIEPGGVFVFDLNTPYKHERVLANNRFCIEAEDGVCVWNNAYDADEARTEITITVKDAQKELFMERFFEYAYSQSQIEAACDRAGLTVQSVCDGETFGCLTAESQRFLFCTIRK